MGCNRRPNKQERHLEEILDKYFPKEWKFVGDGSVILFGLNPDFINCNGQKKIIEVFGDYWHSKEGIAWHRTELGRIMAYNSIGYRTLIVWESELKDEEAVIAKIQAFMRERQC